MASIVILLLIFVLVAGAAWVVLIRQRSEKKTPQKRVRPQTAATAASPGGLEKLRNNPAFWGVEMGQPGCEAAQALLGKQYPFDKAPQLPLPGCNSANCTCQFKGLKERRTWVRRQQEDRRESIRFDKDRPDRRSRKDRRRGNVWIDHEY